MDERMHTAMTEATRLTRAGQLIEATNLLCRSIKGSCAALATSGESVTAESEAKSDHGCERAGAGRTGGGEVDQACAGGGDDVGDGVAETLARPFW